MKLHIVTTDKRVLKWRSLPAKLDAIRTALNQTENATWEVSIEYQDVTPEVRNGRITHAWFNDFSFPLFRKNYHHVYLHFSMRRWDELGLDQAIRGANHIDDDYVGESYGRGDENTTRGRGGLNQFVQNVLHEMSHELARSTDTPDNTHVYHAIKEDISGIFTSYDMKQWQPRYQEQLSTIQRLMQTLKALLNPEPTLYHPVQFTPRIISQPYGKASARYPRTGRHIGTDYAIPVGTPLYAPFDGEVTAVGTGKATGHFLHFTYTFQGETYEERWCHLQYKPSLGKYRRGIRIATSGNTGMSTGPHLHREKWRDDVRIDLITKDNWDELTLDPELT